MLPFTDRAGSVTSSFVVARVRLSSRLSGTHADVVRPRLVAGAVHGQHAAGDGDFVELLAVFIILDVDLTVIGQRHFDFPVLHVKAYLADLRVRGVALFHKGFVTAGAAGQNESA